MSKRPGEIATAEEVKGRLFGMFEGAALALILALAALRTSFIEDLHNTMPAPGLWMTPRGISLILTGALAAILFCWLLAGLLRGRIVWRSSGLGWGVLLFFAAGALSVFGSSDKRAAITEAATLAVPMAAAWAMACMMDRRQRVRALLWVIIAMGCAAVYQSIDQYMTSNDAMIEDYKSQPQRQLEAMGIEPNSLAQWQYEHRLYSKDVRGFLTTSNSTGTFLLLAIFAAAGLLAQSAKQIRNEPAKAVLYGLVLIILLAGFIVCKSRGAIAAGVFAAIVFCVLLAFGKKLWQVRMVILLSLAAAAALIISAIVWYGSRHGRLPGPNALFVRWQYWVGAGRMIAEHPFVGTGGGNFGIFYPQYKIAAAPETVRDPHNFILSLLCQYGPLGLAAVLASLGAVFWKVLRGCYETDACLGQDLRRNRRGIALWAMAGVLAGLLFIRPVVMESGLSGAGAAERQAAYVAIYLVQAVFFAMAFMLMWATDESGREDSEQTSRLAAGLVCGAAGAAVHNLIDFGIFEPGVWMSFWLLAAAAASVSMNRQAGGGFKIFAISGKAARLGLGLAATLAFAGWLWFVVITPVRAQSLIERALAEPMDALKLLEKSGRIDLLDPEGLYMAAQLNVARYEESIIKQQVRIEDARRLLLEAQGRDLQNFRYPRLLSRIYLIYADQSGGEDKSAWLEKAYQAEFSAQNLYPGADITAFSLGELAEKLGREDEAAQHYFRAVQIERQYRLQFEKMYPGRDVLSRLGEKRYEYAVEYLKRRGGED